MREWFKTYGVACVLLGSALFGGTIWMVEKEVQAQTAVLRSEIAILSSNVTNLQKDVGGLQKDLGSLQKHVGNIEAQQKRDSEVLNKILQRVTAEKTPETKTE